MCSLPRQGEGEVFVEREAGYLAAMAEAGLSDRARIWRVRERDNLPGLSLDSILEADPRPEAIFCWSDIHAVELLNRLRVSGVAVPGEVAVIGYDNTPAAALPLVGLSSVDQSGERIGELAARALLSRIEGRTAAEHHLVPPRLVSRVSG